MPLSRETTTAVMRSLNTEFNMWESHPGDPELVGYWQERLEHAGMTDTNARELRQGFVQDWRSGNIPTLHHVCAWIREHLAAEQSTPPDRAGRTEAMQQYAEALEREGRLRRAYAELSEADRREVLDRALAAIGPERAARLKADRKPLGFVMWPYVRAIMEAPKAPVEVVDG